MSKPSADQIERALSRVVENLLSGEEFDDDIMERCRAVLSNILRDTTYHVDAIEEILAYEFDPEIDGDDRNTALRAQEGGQFRG